MATLVPQEKQAFAQTLIEAVLDCFTSPVFLEAALKKVVLQGVQEALAVSPPLFQQHDQQTPPQTKPATWAIVAAGTIGPPQFPVKAPPPSRLARKVLVRGTGQSPSLVKRTPQEIVQAVNTASVTKGAVTARKLPSRDVVVTFYTD